jgi:hypothetical protein
MILPLLVALTAASSLPTADQVQDDNQKAPATTGSNASADDGAIIPSLPIDNQVPINYDMECLCSLCGSTGSERSQQTTDATRTTPTEDALAAASNMSSETTGQTLEEYNQVTAVSATATAEETSAPESNAPLANDELPECRCAVCQLGVIAGRCRVGLRDLWTASTEQTSNSYVSSEDSTTNNPPQEN